MAIAKGPYTAEWNVTGPALASVEVNGYLGIDYTDSVDTRWPKHGMCLGPLLTVLDCSARGATLANVNGFAVAPITMQAAGPMLYGSGGTRWLKVVLTGGTSALTVLSDGSEAALGEASTGVLYTKNAAGTEEISFSMAASAYRVITAVGAGAVDTDSANASTLIYSVLSPAGSDAGNRQIACLGRGSTAVHNRADQITLSGSVSMATPSATNRAIIGGEPITFTGFALDGINWLLGTSNGAYYLNEQFAAFSPVIEELDNDATHGLGMALWSIFNNRVLIPLRRSLRYSKNVTVGGSVGPGEYETNNSSIGGGYSAFCSSERWGYGVFYNPVSDKSWLCAMRPRVAGDWHGQAISYFPIAKLADGVESHAAIYTGTQGHTARTQPLVIIGHDTNIASFDEGRVDIFPDDTGYPYAPSGAAYFTEMRRQPESNKDISHFVVEVTGCDAGKTVTLSLTSTDENGTASTVQLGGPINTNGRHRIQVRGKTDLPLVRFPKPQIAFVTDSSASSPKVTGLSMVYALAELSVQGG